jgi:hypothetical protein
MLQNEGHVDMRNSAPWFHLFHLILDVRAAKEGSMPMYKTQRIEYIYIHSEIRIAHVLELKVKTNRSYKIFKIRRNQERKVILPTVLKTAFKFVLEYSK